MNLTVDGGQAFAYTAAHALDPAKPTVVFAHGAGLDHSWFGLQSRYFGYHGRNALALDFPGHGRSPGPPLATIPEMADWLLRLLDAAKLDKASVAGHSMGALVALECAARHAQRIERIALLGVAYPMKVSAAFLEAAQENRQDAYDMETIWGHAPQVPLGGNPNPGMWMYGDTLARLARLAPGVLYSDLTACNEYAGGEAAAAKVKCPVLFVLGQRDQMTAAKAGLAFARTLPGAQVVQIAPSGHSLMAEAPDAVLDALAAFLA
ncbi:MAG: alpha/beta hydrolase [Betaproteobacteria bacterium]|nr:alpha/beta hydrolase [Betaproteobacteria bacterium]